MRRDPRRGGPATRARRSAAAASAGSTSTDHAGARRPSDDLLALDEALARLADEDPLAAEVVELRYFAGLGHEEIAAALGITVVRRPPEWTYARAWLRDRRPGRR